ncbi:MAG: 6-carboxytetrahydropterin synthase QueD [bacterium]|nr:6-carboxytetrahydropterin synthase QueD [bacterium]MCP4799344.1 6-carboxytetrahydropterin synthase QueD [bacterium]
MPTRITKSFTLDAAHWLPNVPKEHKCGRLHGHTYKIIVGVEGDITPDTGWIVDYNEIKAAFEPLLTKMDHFCLNEIPGLENPTAEVMAEWIFKKISKTLPQVSDITVCETPTTAAIYKP